MPHSIDDTALRRLLAEGISQREISRRLGVPRTTLQEHLKRQGLAVQRPPAAPAPQVPPAPPAMTFVAVPELQEMVELLRQLHTRVESLEQTRVPPALPAPPAPPAPPTAPAPPASERKDIQQWTLRLSKALIEHIKAVAYERRVNPSELVEAWLWTQAHHESRGEP